VHLKDRRVELEISFHCHLIIISVFEVKSGSSEQLLSLTVSFSLTIHQSHFLYLKFNGSSNDYYV
jgi:hypothetical protein